MIRSDAACVVDEPLHTRGGVHGTSASRSVFRAAPAHIERLRMNHRADRWHSRDGRRVLPFRRGGSGPDALVHLHVPAGMSRECPERMCDAARCGAMPLCAPQLSVQPVVQLRRVLSKQTTDQRPRASRGAIIAALPIVEGAQQGNAERLTRRRLLCPS